jgi:hypothetical protein
MDMNQDFIDRFEKEIEFLKRFQKAAGDAVKRAEDRLKEMKPGKSIEEVFGPPPKQ